MNKGVLWILLAYLVTMICLSMILWLLVSKDTSYFYIGILLMSVDSIIFVTILHIYTDNLQKYSTTSLLITKLFDELDKDVNEVIEAEDEGSK